MSNELKVSVYDLQKKWVEEIAPNFFPVPDISLLNIGNFGYINSVMANSMEDNFHAFSIQSKEIFPNKAMLPSSIYAYAALAEYDDLVAKPASLNFALNIRIKDLVRQSTQGSEFMTFNIGRQSKLVISDEFRYIIDYPVIITTKEENGRYLINARYDMDSKNAVSDIKNPYIRTLIQTINGEDFVTIFLVARQLERFETKFTNYSVDVISSINYEVNYIGKLAGFNVYYRDPISSSYSMINKYYQDSNIDDDRERFCFYTFVNDNTINISFSAHPSYFKPEFNSDLLIEIFTTEGAEGNFNYIGTRARFEFELNDAHDYSQVLNTTEILTESVGGQNLPELGDIKKGTIRALFTRGNYITEKDLSNFFEEYEKETKILFTKKRDDLIKRIYSAFAMLKNSKGDIIPTNTINLVLQQSDFEDSLSTSTYTLKPGQLITPLNLEEDNYEIEKKNLTMAEILDLDRSPNNYLYGCPFLVKVTKEPLFVSYFLNSVFDTYNTEYVYSNDNVFDQFSINRVNIERNGVKSNTYKIEFNLNTNLNPSNMVLIDNVSGAVIEDLQNVVVKMLIKEHGSTLGVVDCKILSYDKQTKSFKYQAVLDTTDTITGEDKLHLEDCVYMPSSIDKVLQKDFYIANRGIDFEFVVLSNQYKNKDKDIYGPFLPVGPEYCVTNVFTIEEVELFKNLNNIMSSSIVPKLTPTYNELYYRIKSMPVTRYVYLDDNESMKELIQDINNYKTILLSLLERVENNFDIDLKFYNTYGRSKFFTIGRDKTPLNLTSVTISFDIKTVGQITATLHSSINEFITKFVEDTNDTTAFNSLYVSNLIRALENNFEEIAYVIFNGFNTYSSQDQIIENNFRGLEELTKEQIIKFVPEYLNINRRVTSSGETPFTPDIVINYI